MYGSALCRRNSASMRGATALVSTAACTSLALAALPPVGAAPQGDATVVASRVIKYNFPACKYVTDAARAPDGSIRASCDGARYLVFTMFDAKAGKALELAMNCTASKKLLNVDC